MEVLLVLVIINILAQCSSSKPEIVVTCVSCKTGSSQFDGQLGSTLRLRYTISTTDFTLLTIKYQGTTKNVINILPTKFSVKRVVDKRLTFVKKTSENNEQIYEVSINGLKQDDDGSKFEYEYTDRDAGTEKGENTVRVVTGGGEGDGTCNTAVNLRVWFLGQFVTLFCFFIFAV